MRKKSVNGDSNLKQCSAHDRNLPPFSFVFSTEVIRCTLRSVSLDITEASTLLATRIKAKEPML